MFDSVILKCPSCGEGTLEWQSKSGPCMLKVYTLENVPPHVAGELDGDEAYCDNPVCDFVGTLRVQSLVRVE